MCVCATCVRHLCVSPVCVTCVRHLCASVLPVCVCVTWASYSLSLRLATSLLMMVPMYSMTMVHFSMSLAAYRPRPCRHKPGQSDSDQSISVQSGLHVSHLDARAGQVHITLPLRLHSSVLGRLGVASLMSSGHGLARRQRDDTGNDAHDGAYRALTPGGDAGQQVGSEDQTELDH